MRHKTGLAYGLGRGRWEPCRESYWATPGLTRADLAMAMQQRRSQQQLPSESELQHDPSLAATVSLAAHKVERRKRVRA